LWLYRFGHRNFQHLHQLSKKKIVTRVREIGVPKEVCKECIEDKHTRPTSKKFIPTKATKKLGVVYSNVCGSLQVETPSGNKYIVTFVNDLTRKMWTYSMKRKNEVLFMFERFKKMVE